MKLNAIRKKIDRIDESIVSLLAKRFQMSMAIKEIKREKKLPTKDTIREKEVYHHISRLCDKHRITFTLIKKLYATILEESVSAQKNKI